mgnify:CR=1 FL=1
MAKDKNIQWHPAFYGAMHLEFRENKEELEFTEELILNTLPLRVDMLVVKKKQPCILQNEIGQLFRKSNLVEYKSPDDALNYDVFLKGIAYAYLYKIKENHTETIPLEEITLTFVRERKPVKLLKKLRKQKFHIEQKWKGIYYISKEGELKIQLVVTKELSRENHIWLNSLSANMQEHYVTELLTTTRALIHKDEKKHADSLWEVVTRTNTKTIKKLRKDDFMCKALAEIMKPEIDEAFNNGHLEGFNSGRIEGEIKSKVNDILSFLNDLGNTPDKTKKKIQNETNLDVLSKWVKLAGKADSIESFIEKM